MDIKQSLEKLFSLHTFGIKLGLDNIRAFLEHIGNPQNSLKAFHIAGSNGKGSTSSFIASILMEAGYKVGLYTSPHFVRFNERIIIDGKYIEDEFIADFINKHNDYIDDHGLTFFEVTTALAFEYFKVKKVDYAVIETGLGGRLDATNVLNPLACIITSISLEHTNILGDKISQIAYEKGEIIKPKCKVFIGKLSDVADSVIENKCNQVKAKLFRLEDYLIEKNDIVELYTEEIELQDWEIPLKGKYQRYNAALAVLAVTKTLDIDEPRIVYDGIKNVIKNTLIQGRYEYIRRQPYVLLDSAHNPDGLKVFLNEFRQERKNYKKTSILFSALKDKDIDSMIKLLINQFDDYYITEINYERAEKIDDLKKRFENNNIKTETITDKRKFLSEFLKGDKNNCLVITGSMYLLGEIKSIIEEL
ncbi:MAG: bifunctional folylpolyglutamate synthase/dihydrofolate synthase [Ignavibacterium album]|jgi:dihydrofolate synthase/folylpolyglutamate synthase|uniref:Dihydrofolate synthase/folylpolyglutamate synthase n=1 Tax=Ignavibacterium album TaxID=591197 RepID=A0A7V3E7E4_9BACT|nr:folylpolyglutamate synthase/dihydrofolate synthase family protein [Ignavibacterium album]MCX8106982.1 bifunctional folylpolyglutamate synthase/dihydrofolate synthase [Ignavibacterium album]